jgi:hypothetical protein
MIIKKIIKWHIYIYSQLEQLCGNISYILVGHINSQEEMDCRKRKVYLFFNYVFIWFCMCPWKYSLMLCVNLGHWSSIIPKNLNFFKCSYFKKCEFHRTVNLKIIVLWDVMPSSPVESYQHFRETCYLNLKGKTISWTGKQAYRYSKMCTANMAASRPVVDGDSWKGGAKYFRV